MGYVAELRSLVGTRPLILAGAGILIVDTDRRLLLVQRSDNDTWTIPGGYLESGESLEDCARREALEETGLTVGEVELFGVFSGPGQFYRYPHGDQVHNVTAVYLTRQFHGVPRVDPEGKAVQFFDRTAIPQEISPPTDPVLRAYLTRAQTLLGPPPDTLGALLDDPREHDFPSVARILGGLTSDQALTVPPGLPYGVAHIVAHMLTNMRFNLEVIQSNDPTGVQPPRQMWPQVTASEWPSLAREFLATLETLHGVARQAQGLDRVVYPADGDEPAWAVGYKLACSVAKHNAYHLGQVVVLRRLLGAWDDPK